MRRSSRGRTTSKAAHRQRKASTRSPRKDEAPACARASESWSAQEDPRMNQPDKQVPATLSEEHARLLEWYFGVGRATFGRSTCGPIIERLQMYAFGSDACAECNGTGFRGGWSYGTTPKRTRAEELAALLAVPRSPREDPDARCERCKGSGVTARPSRRRA